MLFSGTDPEPYISEYIVVYEEKYNQWIHRRFQVGLSGTWWCHCRAAYP